jgi:hydroxyacylglutathione hydrolase
VLVEHPERAERLSRLTAADLAVRRAEVGDRMQLIDVRTPSEVAVAPLDGARNVPLTDVRDTLDDLDRDAPVVAVCAGGARSAVAAGLLAAAGFADVSDVLGGYAALSADTDR